MKKFPRAKIVPKEKSKWLRWMRWIDRENYEQVTVVLGTSVYVPSRCLAAPDSLFLTLAHEFVHMVDRKNEPKLFFELKYLFPQVLAVLAVFSVFAWFSYLFLLFMVFLYFLIPGIPSRTRLAYEANAYAMTLYLRHRATPWNWVILQDALDIATDLAGITYYYACNNRQWFVAMLQDRYDVLPKTHEAFIEVRTWLQKIRN